MRRVIAVLVAVLACVSSPGAGEVSASSAPGPAQELQVPSLDRIDSLTAAGRVEAARETLTAWWDARFQDAPPLERQRALWLRGKLTVDPEMARRDYLRLVLEYPGGPHSADALLRLGQAEHGAGRMAAAGRYFEQLLRDYPGSPHRLEARRWLDEYRELLARARAQAGRSPGPGTPGATDQADPPAPARRPSARAEAPDSTAPGAGAPDPAPVTPDASDSEPGGSDAPEVDAVGGDDDEPPAGDVSVQLGAFSTEERARELIREARAAGFGDVRVVRLPGSRLVRVRAGRFMGREGAGALRARLRGAGFEAVIVTDADAEEPVP